VSSIVHQKPTCHRDIYFSLKTLLHFLLAYDLAAVFVQNSERPVFAQHPISSGPIRPINRNGPVQNTLQQSLNPRTTFLPFRSKKSTTLPSRCASSKNPHRPRVSPQTSPAAGHPPRQRWSLVGMVSTSSSPSPLPLSFTAHNHRRI
jgi:hypothetical protein